MLARRLISLVAALVLACAGTQAHAYARPLLPESALPARARLSEAVPGQSAAVSHECIKENWHPPQKAALELCVYANANPLIYIDPDGRVGFLTTARNFFDRADAQLREVAVANPGFADKIGIGRGLASLLSAPVRASNLASDVIAQALPGNAFSSVADQGAAELGNTLDAVVPFAAQHLQNPLLSQARLLLGAGTAAARTTASALSGNGGAISDINSFATQLAVPLVGAEVGAANGFRLSTRDLAIAGKPAVVTEGASGGVTLKFAPQGITDAPGTQPQAKFVYDGKIKRFRDSSSGRIVAQRDLPFPGNDGFAPDRARGTLAPGAIIDRVGRLTGRFASDSGASVSARGLPAGSEALPFTRLRVLGPIEADIGSAAAVPEFGATGGGKQFFFDTKIQDLIDQNLLEIVP